MTIRLILPILLSLSIVACGSSSNDSASDNSGDTTGGDTTGGDTTGGDTTGGDTTGGDTTGGDTTGGNTGGDNSGSISGTVRYLGLVSVDEDVQDNEVEATGSFIRYTSDIAGNLFANVYTPQLDICTVETLDNTDVNTNFPDIDTNVLPELVSAGEVIPLTSSAGTYIQLQRQNLLGFLFYEPEPESVPGPIPSQLTLDIPGDVFPAFANVAMPTVQPLVVSSPQGQPVTPSTNFSWTSGTNADAYITISATAIDTTGVITFVECEVTDDGQFTFPAQTQSAMGASFSSISAEYLREVLTFQQQGNALLILNAASGN